MVSRLQVHIDFGIEHKLVGTLVAVEQSIFFKYDSAFLDCGYNISPYKLKWDDSLQKHDSDVFGGLIGVFADSLPDGWGMLLMDRYLKSNGYSLSEIGTLDRLSLMGENGQGALTYSPVFLDSQQEEKFKTLDQVYTSSMALHNQLDSDQDIEALFRLGGSPGGARPKVMVKIDDDNKIHYDRETKNCNWIIKFPATTDMADIAEVEYAYYLMAKESKISMSECRLLKSESGKSFFATKRFDQDGQKRLHMISAAGLLHDNYRYSDIDYGHLLHAGFDLSKNVSSYEQVLRLCIFNVLLHNRDDHSKNFSFLMSDSGDWSFAPAYDLTYSNSAHGQHSTTVSNEGNSIKREHIDELAKHFSIADVSDMISEVMAVRSKWSYFADEAGVSQASKTEIQKVFNTLHL